MQPWHLCKFQSGTCRLSPIDEDLYQGGCSCIAVLQCVKKFYFCTKIPYVRWIGTLLECVYRDILLSWDKKNQWNKSWWELVKGFRKPLIRLPIFQNNRFKIPCVSLLQRPQKHRALESENRSSGDPSSLPQHRLRNPSRSTTSERYHFVEPPTVATIHKYANDNSHFRRIWDTPAISRGKFVSRMWTARFC